MCNYSRPDLPTITECAEGVGLHLSRAINLPEEIHRSTSNNFIKALVSLSLGIRSMIRILMPNNYQLLRLIIEHRRAWASTVGICK